MAENDQERTEEATQQRREEFRKRGQVAQTREFASVLALLGCALLFWALSRFFLSEMYKLFQLSMTDFIQDVVRRGDYMPAVFLATKTGFLLILPIAGSMLLLGVTSSILQTGFMVNEEALEINWERLNPIVGFQKIMSTRALVEGAKALVKMVFIASIIYLSIRDQISRLPTLTSMGINQIAQFMATITLRLLASVGLLMLVIAAADYFFQWFTLEKEMRMTKQEVKEEHKSREGDPLIKARIRRVQRDLANRRMMSEVPKADVVVTNPTHIAVALRYDPDNMAAPRVIAKGAGFIAEKIKAIAREHNIPTVENKPLARTMFKMIKVGQTIPRELFTAVAQVLSYVYKVRRRRMPRSRGKV